MTENQTQPALLSLAESPFHLKQRGGLYIAFIKLYEYAGHSFPISPVGRQCWAHANPYLDPLQRGNLCHINKSYLQSPYFRLAKHTPLHPPTLENTEGESCQKEVPSQTEPEPSGTGLGTQLLSWTEP